MVHVGKGAVWNAAHNACSTARDLTASLRRFPMPQTVGDPSARNRGGLLSMLRMEKPGTEALVQLSGNKSQPFQDSILRKRILDRFGAGGRSLISKILQDRDTFREVLPIKSPPGRDRRAPCSRISNIDKGGGAGCLVDDQR